MRTSLVIAAALLGSCASDTEAPDPAATGPVGDTVKVAFQSRVDGEIEPCG